MAKQIKVRLHLPQTEAGKHILEKRIMQANADLLAGALNHSGAPHAECLAIVQALDGAAPWAAEGQRRLAAYVQAHA